MASAAGPTFQTCENIDIHGTAVMMIINYVVGSPEGLQEGGFTAHKESTYSDRFFSFH